MNFNKMQIHVNDLKQIPPLVGETLCIGIEIIYTKHLYLEVKCRLMVFGKEHKSVNFLVQ